MRHIPKLAAVVGTVTIGVLGFQGVAGAGTHSEGSWGQGQTQNHKPQPPKIVVNYFWWLKFIFQYKPPYPGIIKPPPRIPYPVVFYRYPCQFLPQVTAYHPGKDGGFKLLSVDTGKGHR
jgi:hypothetical protein